MNIGDAIRSALGKNPAPVSDGGEAPAPGARPAEGSPDLAALASEARQGRKRGGKVRANADEALAAAQYQAAIDELYTAENWEEIAALYFETRYAVTGFDEFRLSEKQTRVLSSSLAMTMKTLAITDPKYVALTIFGINFCGIIAQKEMKYARVVAAQNAKARALGTS